MHQVTAFSLLLMALCSCEQQSISRQEPTTATDPVAAHVTPATPGGITNGPSLPSPTIITQTYVPTNEFFDHVRCRAWRITWPTYPAGTSANLIPTMFSIAAGTPYSFNYLNNTGSANTYKTNFNLYYDNKLETTSTLWEELTHVLHGGNNVEENTRFNKSTHTAAQVETWVKGRPDLFEFNWKDDINTSSEMKNYQKGDIYIFKLVKQKRYGGIRIVSVTPRIIEVYSVESNE